MAGWYRAAEPDAILQWIQPLVHLPRQAPLVHRAVQWVTARGARGSLRLWRVVERFVPLPSTATICVCGQPLSIDMSDTIGPYMYRGVYERWELEIMARIVRPGGSCVDVGANEGLYTVAMRALLGPAGSVIAIEPQPDLSRRLSRLDSAPAAGAPVVVLPLALGASDGTARLQLFPRQSGLATLRDFGEERTASIDVPVRRLDGVEEVACLSEIEFLKVDVESFELEVLRGATTLLSSGRIRAALIEVSADHAEVANIVARLSPRYRSFRVTQSAGAFRYRARLEPLCPEQITSATTQFNMLLCRNDALVTVADLFLEPCHVIPSLELAGPASDAATGSTTSG